MTPVASDTISVGCPPTTSSPTAGRPALPARLSPRVHHTPSRTRVLCSVLALAIWLGPGLTTAARADEDDEALFDPDGDLDPSGDGDDGGEAAQETEADDSVDDDPFGYEEPEAMTAVRGRLALGAGLGSHSQEMPRPQALQSLSSGLLPVIQVSAEVETATTDSLGVGGRLTYATTLGQTASIETTPGVVIDSAARQQSVRGEGYLQIPLSDSPRGVTLPLFLGAGLTGFNTDEPLPAVESTLFDVHLRPALRIPLGPAELEIGPEAGFLLAILDDLPSQGIADTGFSLGGELLLDVSLSDFLAVRLRGHYRQWVMPEQSGERFFVSTWLYATVGLAGYL